MRNNGILNIDVARADLPMQPEYWIEETYVSRYEKLLRVIEKKTSFLPYRNTKVIREISFEVPASTTLEQIKEVSLAFEKRFKVSCFQISIDRSVQVAHLLFAWIDMETGKAVKLDVNTLKRATGMFLRRLKLPHPKDYDKWIRYVLIDAYEECPDVFKQQYRAICKEDKETESSCIIRDALAYAELMSKGLRRRSGESKELERIETEAHRLDSMINDLLVMSRNQAKNALVSETVKANQLWNEVLDNAAFEAEQMGKSFTVEYPPGPWPLYGNPNALESALENIVRNALRYSHTKISVSFSVDKDGITVNVDDDGPGVSPEDREQIFRPFYRTDEARDRESGGTGLGLAIVETAIQQHRGWVKADDSPLGGLRLTIWLPLYKRT